MSSNKEYMRIYMAERYTRRKAEAVAALGGKCAVCGSTDRLEIDHRDRDNKSFTVCRKIAGVSEAKLAEELAKCQLLCWEHHNLKTLEETGRKVAKGTHGTLSAYRYCRCPSCKKAKADYMAEYNKSRP